MRRPNEDAFLGCLLGLSIGDALGMPVAGRSAAEIAESVGRVEGYLPATLEDGTEVGAGEFTDESEIALCIVEAVTANGGKVDVDLLGPRMVHLATGESRRWLRPDTLAALRRAESSLEFRVPVDEDGPATGEVAVRGVPIGLIHSAGAFRPDAMRADVDEVVGVTHGSPAAAAAALAMAFAVRLAVRAEVPPSAWARETADFLGGGAVAERLRNVDELIADGLDVSELVSAIGTGQAADEAVPAAIAAASCEPTFEAAVLAAVNAGGATDTVGALTGAISGARVGSAGIPQSLIDGLEGRIYVSLAAPWLFKAAQRRAGVVIDLRPTHPRPSMPPNY